MEVYFPFGLSCAAATHLAEQRQVDPKVCAALKPWRMHAGICNSYYSYQHIVKISWTFCTQCILLNECSVKWVCVWCMGISIKGTMCSHCVCELTTRALNSCDKLLPSGDTVRQEHRLWQHTQEFRFNCKCACVQIHKQIYQRACAHVCVCTWVVLLFVFW